MYHSHYNLKQKPFQMTADPKFIWLGKKHAEAKKDIHCLSAGVPRLINAICDLALLSGYSFGQRQDRRKNHQRMRPRIKNIKQIRAKLVKNYFINHGIISARIKPIGMGAEYPMNNNDAEIGIAKNHRVEIKLISPQQNIILSQSQ